VRVERGGGDGPGGVSESVVPIGDQGDDPDGDEVVGHSGFVQSVPFESESMRAFRWTSVEGMADLGLVSGWTSSRATGVSRNGAIVGFASNGYGATETDTAIMWNSPGGWIDLSWYLPTLGIDLTGWTQLRANGISADGLTIVGSGVHDGRGEGWVARMPCGSADFNGDGDVGTDADIEAFFACLGGNCCARCGTVDFNGDGDVGTDADIEAFFRILAGGSC